LHAHFACPPDAYAAVEELLALIAPDCRARGTDALREIAAGVVRADHSRIDENDNLRTYGGASVHANLPPEEGVDDMLPPAADGDELPPAADDLPPSADASRSVAADAQELS
jgi:hypothetical protein